MPKKKKCKPEKILSALDVANYFLSLLDEEDSGDVMSNLKLQKLLYFAQGFFLALNNKRLFKEPVMAWTHGPAVPKVYHHFKGYGVGAIPCPNVELRHIPKSVCKFLDEIWKVFGQYSAWVLRNHIDNHGPWSDTGYNEVISCKALKEHFKTQLKDA